MGEPGSGKSTVLRKLAKDLLKEVKRTNKIPIYINLKEWDTDELFTEDNPPKINHLLEFIKNNLLERLGDILVADFLSEYFDELYLQGQLYFIFDSFDEIPMLLDEPEHSWLVEQISSLIYQTTSQNKNAKIILSSRFYRQPTDKFQARIKMHIKPFSDDSIIICFKKIADNSELASKIFSERRELISLARNPFYASLISLYYKDVQQLPTKEVELYDRFIRSRLEQCDSHFSILSKNNLSISDVISYAEKIAIIIFDNAKYGIEIPLSDLYENIDMPRAVIEILKKSKLIRVGGGIKKSISFSHRRFNEYFVACSLMNHDIESLINSIPNNSKWRDTLVLYSQICTSDKADELVKFCCSFFDKLEDVYNEDSFSDMFTKTLHSLRFIIAAFSSQPSKVQAYQKSIFGFVNLLIDGSNLFYYKIAIQAVPILSNENMENVLSRVFMMKIPWINDEIMYSSSYLNSLSPKMLEIMLKHFAFMNPLEFISRFNKHLFYLSLSPLFSKIKRMCILRLIGSIILFILGLFLLVNAVNPHNELQVFTLSMINGETSWVHNLLYPLTILVIIYFFYLHNLTKYRERNPKRFRKKGTKASVTKIAVINFFIVGTLYIPILLFGFSFFFLSFILIFPYSFTELIGTFKLIIKGIKKAIKNNPSRAIIYAFSIAIGCGLFYYFMSSLIVRILLVILGIMVVTVQLFFAISYLIKICTDRRSFSKFVIVPNSSIDIEKIYEMCDSLSTTLYQKKLMRSLREKNVQVKGKPVYRTNPIVNNDFLAQALAQMEEKSFGM